MTNALRAGATAANAPKPTSARHAATAPSVMIARRGRPVPNARNALSALTGLKAHPGVHGQTCATVRPAPNVRSAANALPAPPLAPASRRRAPNNRASGGARPPYGKPKWLRSASPRRWPVPASVRAAISNA